MKPALLSLLVLFLVSPLYAICDLHLRTENNRVVWDAIAGAERYWVQESFDSVRTSQNYTTQETSVPIAHRASVATSMRYTITAEIMTGVRSMDVNSSDACRSSIEVTVPADAAFRALTRRAVLPIVGSTPGAFGGQFRTSLIMHGTKEQKGRLVFHPAGKVASDGDPSMAYAFTATSTPLVFDDVVQAMGQSGLGSIDVIPDEDASQDVPDMEVRLYNDTSIGTFGTSVPAAFPYEYLSPWPMNIIVPDARFRLNIGLRTLTNTTIKVLVFSSERRLRDLKDLAFPAGWTQMSAASEFVRTPLAPGETVTLLFTGTAIPFYTITENRTNDPTLVLGPTHGTSTNVNDYID